MMLTSWLAPGASTLGGQSTARLSVLSYLDCTLQRLDANAFHARRDDIWIYVQCKTICLTRFATAVQ